MDGTQGILDELSRPLPEAPSRPVAQYTHSVSARLTAEQMIAADALRSTFPSGRISDAIQWIFSSAEGRELIARRVRGEI